ncbi:hypothetical protein JAAARDRAFT_95664, partial [Jaapia argillacea MUCL 33604]
YMDEFYGWDFADNLVMFHGQLRPYRQVQLLQFWDTTGCPCSHKKQEHGSTIKIIGFYVDITSGSISLTPSSISDLVGTICGFLDTVDHKPPLRQWQRLAGHLNWLLNVLPWDCPALSELYRKTKNKTSALACIPINSQVKSDLLWLTDIIPRSIGV